MGPTLEVVGTSLEAAEIRLEVAGAMLEAVEGATEVVGSDEVVGAALVVVAGTCEVAGREVTGPTIEVVGALEVVTGAAEVDGTDDVVGAELVVGTWLDVVGAAEDVGIAPVDEGSMRASETVKDTVGRMSGAPDQMIVLDAPRPSSRLPMRWYSWGA
jgi:hypothetical protein